MKRTLLTMMVAVFLLSSHMLKAQEVSKEIQIAGALMAAPEALREGAAVLGYDKKGKLKEIKKGTNNMICVADDPSKEGFNAAAYHKDLEPFMARGRELREEGKSNEEVFKIREDEVKSGKLKIPNNTTLHILSGKDAYYDEEKKEVVNGSYRWVVYIPYATAESTGLPLAAPGPGAPWLMDPGTHRAHIMITPPRN